MTDMWYEDPDQYYPDSEYNEPGPGFGDYPDPGFQGDPYDDYGPTYEPTPGYQGDPYDDGGYYGTPTTEPVYPIGDPVIVTAPREYDDEGDYGFPVMEPVYGGGGGVLFGPIEGDWSPIDYGGYDAGSPTRRDPGVGITSRPPQGSQPPPSTQPRLPEPTTPRYPVPGRTSGPPTRYPTPAGPYPTIRNIWDSGRATQAPALTRSGVPVSTAGPRVGAALSDKTTLLAIAAGIGLLYFATKK